MAGSGQRSAPATLLPEKRIVGTKVPTAEAHVSAAFLLLDGDVVHQPGHLVQGPGQFTVRAGHGLEASNRDGPVTRGIHNLNDLNLFISAESFLGFTRTKSISRYLALKVFTIFW